MNKKTKGNFSKINLFGNLLIVISVVLILFILGPAIIEELKFNFNNVVGVKYSIDPIPGSFEKKLEPPNTDFSIVIPKIGASAPIVENVDPNNSKSYYSALSEGVAHAKGTSLPGNQGNIYLFAHSTDAFYNATRYNAVFYLIGKLEKDDEIDVYYKGVRIKYKVFEKKVVGATDTKYLNTKTKEKILTLQTCYPPGTTLNRLIVLAKQVEE